MIEKYLSVSGSAMVACAMTYDYARSAEKMCDPNCVGEANLAWQEGPYLSSPANCPQLNRSHPYIFRTSLEHQVLAGIVMGRNPEGSDVGRVLMPLPPLGQNRSRVEPVIAKLSIIEQFELFKEYLMAIDGPYNNKRSKDWEGQIEGEVLEEIKRLTNRRNQLTHDQISELPTMREAVDFCSAVRRIASKLSGAI